MNETSLRKQKIIDALQPLATRVFCPTGPGGGIDPTCGVGKNPPRQKPISRALTKSDIDDLLSKLPTMDNPEFISTTEIYSKVIGEPNLKEAKTIPEGKAIGEQIEQLEMDLMDEDVTIDPIKAELNIKDIIACQNYLHKNGLRSHLSKPIDDQERSEVVKLEGKYYQLEGHHRTAAQVLRGYKKIKVYVMNYDAAMGDE